METEKVQGFTNLGYLMIQVGPDFSVVWYFPLSLLPSCPRTAGEEQCLWGTPPPLGPLPGLCPSHWAPVWSPRALHSGPCVRSCHQVTRSCAVALPGEVLAQSPSLPRCQHCHRLFALFTRGLRCCVWCSLGSWPFQVLWEVSPLPHLTYFQMPCLMPQPQGPCPQPHTVNPPPRPWIKPPVPQSLYSKFQFVICHYATLTKEAYLRLHHKNSSRKYFSICVFPFCITAFSSNTVCGYKSSGYKCGPIYFSWNKYGFNVLL